MFFRMPKIKAIVFDAGGVIQGGSGRHFLAQVKETLGLLPTSTPANKSIFDRKMNLGRISVREMLAKKYPNASRTQIGAALALWEAEWPSDKHMVGLAKRLKKRCRIFLLSNSDPVHEKRLREEGVLGLFEKPVLSHRVHMLKPGRGIFGFALKKWKAKAEECVFVDDAEENIKTAKEMGFATIHFSGQRQLEAELEKLGVL